jgi:predicted ATP-grasp superfamily ATP-dependent carboligase
MEEEKQDYILAYTTFEENFKKTEVSAEEVGELIMHMTGFYIRYNVKLGNALRNFSAVKASFQANPDPQTGKAISSSKAEMLADDTSEAAIYEMARIHVNNIQEIINSMKSLQKGVMNEYAGSQ